MRFGKEVLGQGDGAFVPGNTPYTFVTGSDAVEFLEFRNATAWNIVFKSRSEESRVGNEGVSKCTSRWSPHHEKETTVYSHPVYSRTTYFKLDIHSYQTK